MHQVNPHLKLIFLIPLCGFYSYCPFNYLCFGSKSNNVMNKYLCMKEPSKTCSGNNKLAVSSWFVPSLFENTFSSSYVYNYISRLYLTIITTTKQRLTCKKYQKTEFNSKPNSSSLYWTISLKSLKILKNYSCNLFSKSIF